MTYSIRRVCEMTSDIAEEIRAMHRVCFGGEVPKEFDPDATGDWWIAAFEDAPIGFCSICPSLITKGSAFLMRAAVTAGHRGHGLQRRMIRARIREARRQGFKGVVSYTIGNPISANNLLRAGLVTYTPNPRTVPPRLRNKPVIYWKMDF